MIGVLAVFFIYNVFGKRDKIFMGDSGSLLLGYLLTAFIFHFCEINAYHIVPETLHMNAAPAVAVCVLTVPLFEPDKNHIHHLLLRTGLNHIQTTCVLLSASVLFIGIGIIGRNWSDWLLLLADFGFATILTLLLWRVINRQIVLTHADH